MPQPTLITDEAIMAAAAELTARGKPITGWRLNRLVRGGNADRLEARARELATPVQEVQPELEAPPLPPILTDRLTEAEGRLTADFRSVFSQAWATATDLAGKRVAEEVNTARARVDEMKDELADAGAELIAADERAEGLTAELAAAKDAVAMAERTQKAAEQAARDAIVRQDELRASVAAADARLMAVLAAIKPSAPVGVPDNVVTGSAA
jgi:hypothetical protein